jgi:hypothetical protein
MEDRTDAVKAGAPARARPEAPGVPALVAALVWAVLLSAGTARADQFGVRYRADAAQRMIVLAVQQGISSLPPTSGQSFTYEYDPETDTFVKSKHLGPVSFRSTETVGEGRFSARVAASYFELSDRFGPVEYLATGPLASEAVASFKILFPDVDVGPAQNQLLTRFGLAAQARVAIFNLSANYGITHNFEVSVNVPLVVTDADADQFQIAGASDTSATPDVLGVPADFVDSPTFPLLTQPCAQGRRKGSCLIDEFLTVDPVQFRNARVGFDQIGVDFPEGSNVGVGRISLDGKIGYDLTRRVQVGFAPSFFFPSPSEDQLAGSDSAAILPRALAVVSLTDSLRLHLDVGYDFDFDTDELRRLVWNGGLSFATSQFAFDAGVGGSEYNAGIEWTPDSATFVDPFGRTNRISVVGENKLGTTFVDFLAGIKLKLSERIVASGSVVVPVNDEGFRPDAIGSLALEFALF